MLYDSYQFVSGMDSLLHELNMKGYQLHALSNYSEWYKIIEDRHHLSQYGLQWSFVSCHSGMSSASFPRHLDFLISSLSSLSPLTFSSPSPFHTHISAGLRKPDPQSYLNACAELNKRPSECVSTSTKKNKTNETTERDILHECFLMQERYL